MTDLYLEKLKTYRRVEMTKYIVFGIVMFVALHVVGDLITQVYYLVAAYLSKDYTEVLMQLRNMQKIPL